MRALVAALALMFLPASANSQSIGNSYYPGGYCTTCGQGNQFGQMPFYGTTGNYLTPSFFPSHYPWWAGYGAMSYSNFYYPGAWKNNGIDGAMYPGHGGGFAAKPNLYVSGPSGTDVKVRVNLAQDSQMLIAVPGHGLTGWAAKISDGDRLSSKGASYDFLYYDYRFNEKKMQDTAGFCTEREGLIPKMADGLKAAGFTTPEIEDFREHWSVKIPPADRYCVFPQDSRFLDRVAPLSIEPKPASVTRFLFVVVLDETFALGRATSFNKAPKKTWDYAAKAEPKRDRAPASALANGIAVREWGVGFLQGR